jgi:hypothetical protein
MFIGEDEINKKKGKTCTGGRTPVLKLFSFNISFSKKEVRMRFLGWLLRRDDWNKHERWLSP